MDGRFRYVYYYIRYYYYYIRLLWQTQVRLHRNIVITYRRIACYTSTVNRRRGVYLLLLSSHLLDFSLSIFTLSLSLSSSSVTTLLLLLFCSFGSFCFFCSGTLGYISVLDTPIGGNKKLTSGVATQVILVYVYTCIRLESAHAVYMLHLELT